MQIDSLVDPRAGQMVVPKLSHALAEGAIAATLSCALRRSRSGALQRADLT
jgi:hypothetical protein